MRTLLLVHGAMHGAWCWEPLASGLRDHGINAIALDLPGNGADLTQPKDTTLAIYAKHLVSAAAALPEPPVIMGHSAGGVAISAALELAPVAFAKAIYLAALLPTNGDNLQTIFSRLPGGHVITPLIYSPDGSAFWMDDGEAAKYFYNDCTAAAIAWALPQLTPQPTRPLLEPIELTEARFGAVEKIYIKCNEDLAVPVALQDIMIGAYPGIRVHELSSDHSPFLSAPLRLAELLAGEVRNTR